MARISGRKRKRNKLRKNTTPFVLLSTLSLTKAETNQAAIEKGGGPLRYSGHTGAFYI